MKDKSKLVFSGATEQDLPGIIELWNACFHDNEAFIRRFFDSIRLTEDVIIGKKDNRIVAHTAAIPLPLLYSGEVLHGIYVYAACVSPQNRGEGIFRHLLEYTDRYANDRMLDFIMLIPATSALTDTYKRYGYSHELAGICPVGENGKYSLTVPTDAMFGLSLSDFDGDFTLLYRLYEESTKQSTKHSFIKPRGFFDFTLREIAPPAQIHLINDEKNRPKGFIVTMPAEGKDLINILQIVFTDEINNDIIANIKKKSTPYPKALCKVLKGGRVDFQGALVDLYGEF